VDFITHAPLDGVMSEEDIQRMVENKRISIPTLTMMKGVSQAKKLDFDNARKTVAALHFAGVPVLAGTDANMSPGVPANVAHGVSLHEELELLFGCGLSTAEVLRAATSLPAKYFGLHDRGVIQPGYRADLILIKDDPIEDIKATRSLQRVWIAGQELKLPQT
jgi:imidazolonepropionase-like amidohydrolase